jgi:uroporphyrin-3 C-methyltransferase
MKETHDNPSEPTQPAADRAKPSGDTPGGGSTAKSRAAGGNATEKPEHSPASQAASRTAADKATVDKATVGKATADEADNPPPRPPDTGGKHRCRATWPGKLALLLSILALMGGGYLAWQGWQLKQQSRQLQDRLSQQVETGLANARAEMAQTVSQISQRLERLQARSEADARQVAELQDRLTRSIQQVTSQRELGRKEWLLAEVEYLLRLANQRVLMEQTPEGALTLLRSAERILGETDDVTLYDVRKALAADIAALEAVPRLDTEGVFLRLEALNRQVDNLPVVPVSERRELPEMLQEITPETVRHSWGEGLKASWNRALDKFEKLIIIRHRDEPIEPLLSPEQAFFLRQNLHLMLEQAQVALLQRKQPPFDSSLSRAREWIATYFDSKDATTTALLEGLAELSTINVAPELPDISASLTSLKEYFSRMQRLREGGSGR